MNYRFAILACFAFLLFAGSTVYGQRLKGASTPLGPDEQPIYTWYGAYVGPSFNSQGGTYVTDCNCPFTGGAGSGMVAGLVIEHQFRNGLVLGGLLGYEGRGITGRFREREGVQQTSPSGGVYTVPITFTNEATLSFHMLSVNPYVKHHLWGHLFGRVGLSAGYVVSSDLKHTKTLETKSTVFPDGEVADVVFGENGSGTVTLEDGPYKNLSSIQLGATLSTGYEIPLSRAKRPWGMDVSAVLVPIIQIYQPFTQLSLNGSDLRVSTLQFLMEFRYNL